MKIVVALLKDKAGVSSTKLALMIGLSSSAVLILVRVGVAVAGLCNLINPERVIVGGLLSRAGELLLVPIRESIRRHAVYAAAERVEVVAAAFVERAELLGSLALALQASEKRTH